MSGRFSNTSAKPRSRARAAELRAGVGDHGEPASALGPLPCPLEVAARLDGGAGLRRREVQRGGGIALEAEPRDGGRVGGVEHVEPRAAAVRAAACGPAPRGTGSSRPCPSRGRARCPRRARRTAWRAPGRSACTSAITGIHPRRSASSVGSSRQRVWSPAKSRRDRVALEQLLDGRRRRRRRSRSSVREPCPPSVDGTVASRSSGRRQTTAASWAHAASELARRWRRRRSRRRRRRCGRGRGTSPRRRRGRGRRRGRAGRGRTRRSARCRCAGRST